MYVHLLMRIQKGVALLAEGVDRNTLIHIASKINPVALLAEGVDRNMLDTLNVIALIASPSSRRAWIEIFV